MKKIFFLTLICVFAGSLLVSCNEDKPDINKSIFVDPVDEPSSFDVWLLKNYINYYNISFLYRIKDIETDFAYNVVPADVQKSKEMAVVLKHVWLEAYEEVAEDGLDFIRTTCPKLFHLYGSAEHDPKDGTIRLGVAEGGMKITITEVNYLDPHNIRNQSYFKTVHHEFGHILNQTKEYDQEFNMISVANYAPSTWINWKESNGTLIDAHRLGFITNYAGKAAGEDFVEILSMYVTQPHDVFNAIVERGNSTDNDGKKWDGGDIILEKLEYVRSYMQNEWKVDIEKLYEVCQRRADEVALMDFDNLYF